MHAAHMQKSQALFSLCGAEGVHKDVETDNASSLGNMQHEKRERKLCRVEVLHSASS